MDRVSLARELSDALSALRDARDELVVTARERDDLAEMCELNATVIAELREDKAVLVEQIERTRDTAAYYVSASAHMRENP